MAATYGSRDGQQDVFGYNITGHETTESNRQLSQGGRADAGYAPEAGEDEEDRGRTAKKRPSQRGATDI